MPTFPRPARFAALIAAILILDACTFKPVQRYQTPRQPVGQTLVASVGDVILRVDRTRDLADDWGHADFFGGKTNEGYSEIRYQGMQEDGTLLFLRQDLDIHTNENTTTRAGGKFVESVEQRRKWNGDAPLYPKDHARVMNEVRQAQTWVPVAPATTIAVPGAPTEVRLPPGAPRMLTLDGHAIRIQDATPAAITYILNAP
jgi:hypothetical protein